jgi:hypothetical protein
MVCDGPFPSLINYQCICVMYNSTFILSFKTGAMLAPNYISRGMPRRRCIVSVKIIGFNSR